MRIRTAILVLGLALAGRAVPAASAADAAPLVVPGEVRAVLEKHCVACHGKATAEGEVRFDALGALEPAARSELFGRAAEQLAFGLMPPADADAGRPGTEQRQVLLGWFDEELRRHGAPTLADRLRLPGNGNRVDHAALFGGGSGAKPFTPARRWRVGPQIFLERILDSLAVPDRERPNFRAQGGLYGVTNPFTLPERSGVRDYDLTDLDGGHLATMRTNAAWLAEKVVGSLRVRRGEPREKVFENPRDRWFPPHSGPDGKQPLMAAFERFLADPSPPTDAECAAAVRLQFDRVLRRPPTDEELAGYVALTRAATDLGGNVAGLRTMLEAAWLESEFLYRLEFGAGEPDEFGRRMLSPREAGIAIACALGDKGPDAALVAAARDGRLKTRADFEREVRRLLADDVSFRGPVDPSLSREHNPAYVSTPHPKLVRFFREFFGYPLALRVFKDIERSDGLYKVPDRGTGGTPGFLVVEADRVVAGIVEQDRAVFETLLTTDRYFVYHNLDNDKGEKRIAGWREVYDTLKGTDWRTDPEGVAQEHAALLRKHVESAGIRGLRGRGDKRHETDLVRLMTYFEETFGRGGRPFTTLPWAHGNRMWHSPFYNLPRTPVEGQYGRDRPFDYEPVQPFAVPHRKGILTHPAWLIAHSQNSATDPVRRGKWIREKLLAGAVPDVPITVDAQIPEHKDRTLRERLEAATAKEACWKCHRHMNPLGLAFEMYDDFGRFRTAESLEHPDNVVAAATAKSGADTYRTAPVVSTGRLDGTGDPALDGDVQDAFDLIDRLARSERVRQSIVRHAFRFFLGRNETLDDAPTLIDADRAYVESGGSFRAVVVSLLTSDSFLYRK